MGALHHSGAVAAARAGAAGDVHRSVSRTLTLTGRRLVQLQVPA
jgi:hypothetical protein